MNSLSGASFSSLGDSADFEADLPLSDRLKTFKSSRFDPDGYVTTKCQNMTEKEIKHLRAYLTDLRKASAEEMRKSVYANYGAFIRTSREITDLEGQLLSMRNLLSSQGTIVHGLAEGVHKDLRKSANDASEDDMLDPEHRELSNMEQWLVEFLENLEVLLAERRVDEALAAFDEGERAKKEATERGTLSQAALLSLQNAITEQRQKLADQLAERASQPSTRGPELRSAVLALKKLGDGPRAHTRLLSSHHQKLHRNTQGLRSQSSSSCGGAYAAALSQLVFSTIAQAASDSQAIFGEDPAFTSELVTWAVKETEASAGLLKRRVLASSAASGSLRVAAECVQIFLAHCSVLEARGLALSPVLLWLFRPCIEQALATNLKRIEQSSAALAASDNWSLAYTPVGARPLRASSSSAFTNSGSMSAPRLSSSAHKFNSMVQEFLEDIGPLESLQLELTTLDGLVHVFGSYVNLLINALPGSAENEDNPEGVASRIVNMAETVAQQIALLANASLLAEELLPRAAMRLLPSRNEENSRRGSDRQNRLPEQREWKKRLQRSVDRLRDSFCRQHALEIIFTEEGDIRLNSMMYMTMDDYPDEPEWFPSPIYQELFLKLTRNASFAADMFVGRERFATILLMRLTETVILWLSDDQTFWEEIEQGHKPLGPLGLRQFYLDMEFVILFASQGRYLSRHLHQVIKNIIERAIEATAATGIDPYSVLPEEEWFADVAQIAIKMLSGKANFGMERDVVSPTAKSISSVVSHGSN